MTSMVRGLREIDDLYFGRTRKGQKPSAVSAALAIATGFMPWRFVLDYRSGIHDESLRKIAEKNEEKML